MIIILKKKSFNKLQNCHTSGERRAVIISFGRNMIIAQSPESAGVW